AALQAEPVEAADRQRGKNPDALMEHAVGLLEGETDLRRSAFGLRRIGHAPMGRHRLARPHRTALAGGVVADGEHEIDERRARLRELAPRLRAEARNVVAEALQKLERVRIDPALGIAAGAEGAEFARAELVENGLRHDRARGVAGTEEQYM